MLHTRRKVAHDVAEKLFELEAAIDHAVGCAGQLAACLPQARLEAKLSAVVGQDAFDHVGDSLASLCQARGKAVAAHQALAVAHGQIGLREYASGDLWKPAKLETPGLTIVASKAA